MTVSKQGFIKCKPWETEFNHYIWYSRQTGRLCYVKRCYYHEGGDKRNLLGYVTCSDDHVIYQDTSIALNIHGGITFRGTRVMYGHEFYAVGFDAGHHNDFIPHMSMSTKYENYRTFKYMMVECEKLAAYLDEYKDADTY